MENFEVLSVLNLRSEELVNCGDSNKKEEKEFIEQKTAISVAPCCRCGDEYSEAH